MRADLLHFKNMFGNFPSDKIGKTKTQIRNRWRADCRQNMANESFPKFTFQRDAVMDYERKRYRINSCI